MSNTTETTATRTRITADWGSMTRFQRFELKSTFEASPGCGATGKNLKIQGAYTFTGVDGRRLLNQARADGRVTEVIPEGEEETIEIFNANDLMRALLAEYIAGRVTLPVQSDAQPVGEEG